MHANTVFVLLVASAILQICFAPPPKPSHAAVSPNKASPTHRASASPASGGSVGRTQPTKRQSTVLSPTASSAAKIHKSTHDAYDTHDHLSEASAVAPARTATYTSTSINVLLAKILALIEILEKNLGRIVANGNMDESAWLPFDNPYGKTKPDRGTPAFYVGNCLLDMRDAQTHFRQSQLPDSMRAALKSGSADEKELANLMINHHLVAQFLAHAARGEALALRVLGGTGENVGKKQVRDLCTKVRDAYNSLAKTYCVDFSLVGAADIPRALGKSRADWVALDDLKFDFIYKPDLPFFKRPAPGQLVKAKPAMSPTGAETVHTPTSATSVDANDTSSSENAVTTSTEITEPESAEPESPSVRLGNALLDRVFMPALLDDKNKPIVEVFMKECSRFDKCKDSMVSLFVDDKSLSITVGKELNNNAKRVNDMKLRIMARSKARAAKERRHRIGVVRGRQRDAHRREKQKESDAQKQLEEEAEQKGHEEEDRRYEEAKKEHMKTQAELEQLKITVMSAFDYIKQRDSQNAALAELERTVDKVVTELNELNQTVQDVVNKIEDRLSKQNEEAERERFLIAEYENAIFRSYPHRGIIARVRAVIMNMLYNTLQRVNPLKFLPTRSSILGRA